MLGLTHMWHSQEMAVQNKGTGRDRAHNHTLQTQQLPWQAC